MDSGFEEHRDLRLSGPMLTVRRQVRHGQEWTEVESRLSGRAVPPR